MKFLTTLIIILSILIHQIQLTDEIHKKYNIENGRIQQRIDEK